VTTCFHHPSRVDDEEEDPQLHVIEPSFFWRFPSLTALSFTRECATEGWDWSLLIDDSAPSLRRLPCLRHLDLALWSRSRLVDDDAALVRLLMLRLDATDTAAECEG
jgi:hypothetical protein